jgi:competence protein ComEC
VALWPRPPAPIAWIASDGDDAAIVMGGREVTLKPGARAYATGLWAQRRGFILPPDPAEAQRLQQIYFECDRRGCAPLAAARPAIAAWWGKRPPKEERGADLCNGARIVVYRADGPAPASCASARVLTRSDFAIGGSAEIFAEPRGWRIAWAQPLRGHRPWTNYAGS